MELEDFYEMDDLINLNRILILKYPKDEVLKWNLTYLKNEKNNMMDEFRKEKLNVTC